MAHPRAAARPSAAAVVLIALGFVALALSRIAAGSEHHAYSSGTLPPRSFHLTAGTTYHLSVRGGVNELAKTANVSAPSCSWTSGGAASQPLTVTPENADTKATNVVASFIAPFTGDLQIECIGWPATFVDDADDTGTDWAGWFLFVGSAALAAGVPLALSAARMRQRRSAAARAREDDEVEGGVDVGVPGPRDGEVADGHGLDVLR